MGTRAVVAAGLLPALLLARDAQANGRFPTANEVREDTRDARHVVLRTTFGIVETRDGGGGWSWTCEQAAGYGSGQIDPAMELTADGGLFVGVADGITTTTDGCTFTRAGGPLEGRYVVDLARDAGGGIVAVTAAAGARATFGVTRDAGATWTTSLLPDDLEPLTVDVAPSNPSRVYVVGLAAFPRFAAIARSDDGGSTWTSSSFDMGGARGVYLSAIDPHDPDRLYARFAYDAYASLYTSSDAGTTWKEARRGAGDLLGFAVAPTGDAVATGGPDDGLLEAGRDLAFTPSTAIHVRCLAWTGSGLYACGEDKSDGFSLGVRRAAGGAFAPLYHLAKVAPRACAPETTVGALCPAVWPDVGRRIGAIVDGPDASPPVADGGAAPAPTPAATEGLEAVGSGCSTSRRPVAALVPLAMVASALAAHVRRRRRRSQRRRGADG